jgi:hypothetical protein
MHGRSWEAPRTAAGGEQILLLLVDDDGKEFLAKKTAVTAIRVNS